MDGLLFAVEALVVIGAIVMGTKSSGVALGIWGGVGVTVLVFGFGLEPGSPPVDAILIILSVILAAATMQVAGGIDWMVVMAARAIVKHPKQVTIIAPFMSFLFCLGAGTGNIVYPLLPVIYDVSYQAKIRPERPLSMTVVVSGIALACSPVSAAMAAMITLTDVAPYNFDMVKVLSITIPAAIVGIIVSGLIMMRKGKDLEDDPEYQARLADGRLARVEEGTAADALTYTTPGRNAAYIFLAGVLVIVMFGLFPDLRPTIACSGRDDRADRCHADHPDGDVHGRRTDPAGRQAIGEGNPRVVGVQGRHRLRRRPVRPRLADRHLHRSVGDGDRQHRRRMGERLQVGVLHRCVPRRRIDDQPINGDPYDRADRLGGRVVAGADQRHVGRRVRRCVHAADQRFADRSRELRPDGHDQARH